MLIHFHSEGACEDGPTLTAKSVTITGRSLVADGSLIAVRDVHLFWVCLVDGVVDFENGKTFADVTVSGENNA